MTKHNGTRREGTDRFVAAARLDHLRDLWMGAESLEAIESTNSTLTVARLCCSSASLAFLCLTDNWVRGVNRERNGKSTRRDVPSDWRAPYGASFGELGRLLSGELMRRESG
jgi:hypothetical protein